MPAPTIECTSPLQRIILERALVLAQELERTASSAPDGSVLRPWSRSVACWTI